MMTIAELKTSPNFASAEYEEGWDHETGKPGIGTFAKAIQVWAVFHRTRPVTSRLAAYAFHVPIHMVEEAVEWHPWMYLDGENIEHEGE